uniref:Uncharacterized protein n=1 Tax=Spironucleus salmonicida TaxID=348837 RepID=V6LNG5_9EUKA|eukprot:EST42274.1 Hypothetical protein SS50377_18574 [Spironucleus salmonicida]
MGRTQRSRYTRWGVCFCRQALSTPVRINQLGSLEIKVSAGFLMFALAGDEIALAGVQDPARQQYRNLLRTGLTLCQLRPSTFWCYEPESMLLAQCIMAQPSYLAQLAATELGTTSTGTPSISIDSAKVGMSGTGIVLDEYAILQYIQQYLNWSLVVYMHWEWCLQGYLVYYYCIYIIYYYAYQYIFTYEPRCTVHQEGYSYLQSTSTGYAEDCLYSIFNNYLLLKWAPLVLDPKQFHRQHQGRREWYWDSD